MHKYPWLLLLLLITYSCKNNTGINKNTACKVIFVNNETALNFIAADSFLELKEIIKIDMGNFNMPEDLFGGINKVIYANNTFYLADYKGKKIIKANKDGKVVAILNQPGEGPGEYKGISQMQLQHDSLLILDGFGKKILIYDTNFTYKSYVPMKDDIYLDDFYFIGNQLLCYCNFKEPDYKSNLLLYDYSNNKIVKKYLTFKDSKVIYYMNLMFNSMSNLTCTNNGVRVLEPLSNTIYNYNTIEYKLDSLYEIKFKSHNMPPSFRYQTTYTNTFAQAQKEGYFSIRDYYFENENYLKFEYTNDVIFIYDKKRNVPIANAQRLSCFKQAGFNPLGPWYPYSDNEFLTTIDGNYVKPAELDKVKDRFKNQEFYHTLRNQAIEGNFFICIWKLK